MQDGLHAVVREVNVTVYGGSGKCDRMRWRRESLQRQRSHMGHDIISAAANHLAGQGPQEDPANRTLLPSLMVCSRARHLHGRLHSLIITLMVG